MRRFRAWDLVLRKMSYSVIICSEPDKEDYIWAATHLGSKTDENICSFDDKSGILMQWAGLVDGNGEDKDWWEGDILDNDVARWEVIVEEGCFCIKRLGYYTVDDKFNVTGYVPDTKISKMHIALRTLEKGRKVGNIYENSDLT